MRRTCRMIMCIQLDCISLPAASSEESIIFLSLIVTLNLRRIHAADVLRNLYMISTRGGLLQAMSRQRGPKHSLNGGPAQAAKGSSVSAAAPSNSASLSQPDALLLLGVLLAAVIHDFDHRGLTNAFLIHDQVGSHTLFQG